MSAEISTLSLNTQELEGEECCPESHNCIKDINVNEEMSVTCNKRINGCAHTVKNKLESTGRYARLSSRAEEGRRTRYDRGVCH